MTKPIPHPDSRFTVLWQVEDYERRSGRRYTQWLCQCVCGKTKKVQSYLIRNGHKKSCGCLRSEQAKKRWKSVAAMGRKAYSEKCKARRDQHAATT